MKNRNFQTNSYYRSVLLLAFFILTFYILKTYDLKNNIEIDSMRPSKNFYVEIEKGNNPSFILELSSYKELEELASRYHVTRIPRNGDKLMVLENHVVVFSRINGRRSLALGVPIGINSATQEDLTILPGIGRTLAQRIIEYRRSKGDIKKLSALKNIKGIGKKKFNVLKPLVSLD